MATFGIVALAALAVLVIVWPSKWDEDTPTRR